ncbi:SlyX family protein [Thalassotalea atypica]|uniref:SlyX family protein n=1 Tax=Thalassotalea atypica TaxID=2054316 RepID=UPI002574435D|nr:SlyX family protein [Thalassotalea atypica]
MAAAELNTLNELEHRLESLEARNAFQDDVIEQLNQELTIHQAQLAELKENMRLIAARIKESTTSPDTQVEIEPPPPHY